jgi:DNA-binding transcriptional LysR family regulator
VSKSRALEDIRSLRYVLAVRDQRAIGRVAERIGVKVSSVSRRVRNVEDELGLSLFERHAYGVRPTPAGEIVLDGLKAGLDQLDQTFADAMAGGRGELGVIRLGYFWPISTGAAREILDHQHNRAPRVEFQLVEGGVEALLTQLLERRVDIAFLADDAIPKTLARLRVWSERLYFAAAIDAPPLASGWSPLETHPLLAMDVEGWVGFQRMAFLDGGPQFDVRPQHCSREGVLALVATGAGLAIVPESATQLPAPGVRFERLEAEHAECQVSAVWSDHNPNHALRALVSALKIRSRRLSGGPSLSVASTRSAPMA